MNFNFLKSSRRVARHYRIFEEPVRSEIFSEARLEMHGESLARAQTIIDNPRNGRDISPRISENREILEDCYRLLLSDVEQHRSVTPAGEWLIDNFHIVRAQLKDIHDHLSPEYYRELPKLAEGPLAGFPRVYGIAWGFVAHTDSRFDPNLMQSFLHAYQRIQPLTIGELWAVPITLRVVMIENLRRLSARIVGSQLARHDANRFADEILGLSVGTGPTRPPRTIPEIVAALENRPFVSAFAVQLLLRLRFQDSRVDPVLEWLEQRFEKEHVSSDEVVSLEHSKQTGANASVRNIITSCRLMSAFNWQNFFEDVSFVEATLRKQTLYSQMDFPTRDRYRHGLEELGRYSPLTELEVAKLVVEKTQTSEAALSRREELPDPRCIDLGYYLISTGRLQIEKEIGFRTPLRLRYLRWYTGNATSLYLGAIAALSAAFLLATLAFSVDPTARSFADLLNESNLAFWFIAILGLIPASEIAIAFVNRITVQTLGPQYLPRLSLETGVPTEYRTFVVVPTLLTSLGKVDELVDQLEIHYLSNPDGDLYFALLTDFLDSSEEKTATDGPLLEAAAAKLFELNQKYGPTSSGFFRFHIYHRRRLFNASENKWIGWERKRGKLHEFNQLVLGDGSGTSFISLDETSDLVVPNDVRYIVTLDSDTRLTHGAIDKLVGTIAHPLNRARFSKSQQRVIGGYGILQPRITPALPSAKDATIYQRLSTGPSGIDPYASAVSDVYQDLFSEGSYSGKGIYDPRVFEAALENRIPENSMLSHDLFEGNYVRCGFLSDVEFFEDFPSHSEVASSRLHRWTRGDWQLLPWVLGFRGGKLPLINRWKMIDNLRRSLVAPATFAVLFFSLLAHTLHAPAWFVLCFASLAVGTLISFAVDIFPRKKNVSAMAQRRTALQDVVVGAGRFTLFLALLPHHAVLAADAIVRSLFRLFVSRKNLLEWTTAAQSLADANRGLRSFVMGQKKSLILLLIAFVSIAVYSPHEAFIAFPLFLLWFVSPVIAWRASSSPKRKLTSPLEPDEFQLLHLTGRRIWRFFTTFVTAEENYLPPDNFQEDPSPVVAHRSSPTNFGLYLLSTLAARDFGWIGTVETIERIDLTLKSLVKLPKYEGHFYNWYETTEPRALEPKYISSVDNGNLAGHLIATAQGLTEILESVPAFSAFNRGSLDTLVLLEEAIEEAEEQSSEVKTSADRLALLLIVPDHLIENRLEHLSELRRVANETVDAAVLITTAADTETAPRKNEILAWARALKNEIESTARDFEILGLWTLGEPNTSVKLKEIPNHCRYLIQNSTNNIEIEALESSMKHVETQISRVLEARALCLKLCRDMDFGLLYDPIRKLFSIGYRVAEGQLDQSYYDLLASEARLTSLVAIAKGDVPAEHWFRLGRGLTVVDNGVALVSWSGSMFEYLMPSLVMFTPAGSVMEQTCKLIVDKQIDYGREHDIPWGISESAYNKRDLELTYQYSNFGIPELGLKRGLGADFVVAPYATLLAAMINPSASAQNLKKLKSLGALGPYGFYEAVDFTASRLREGEKYSVVKAYMAHHQGMSLVAIANLFKHGNMRKRFHSSTMIQASELLLQERTPRNISITKPAEESYQVSVVREDAEHVSRKYRTVDRPVPTTHLLSNGNYSVMLTSAGSGYSRLGDVALTRWREDVTRDAWGSFFYIKDLENSKVWSAGHQPTCVDADRYEVTFSEDRARFSREDDEIASELEIFVSPEQNAEVRRLTLTNISNSVREIEVTSYSEAVINQQAADIAHPAFSNLFVQTEYLPSMKALVATRRPRSSTETPFWIAQVLTVDQHAYGEIEFETDRAQFIGRGRSAQNPQMLENDRSLSGTVGSVLDPALAFRTRIRLEPGSSSQFTISLIIEKSREDVIRIADKFRDSSTFERVTNLAWTQAQVKLQYLGIEPDEAHLFQRLATRLLYLDPSLRAASDFLKKNRKNVTGLWAQGISGDNPIILVRIDDVEDRGIVRQLLKAQEYLGAKGLRTDLVVLNDKANSYAQELQQSLEAMVHSSTVASQMSSSRGKVFVLRGDLISDEDRTLLLSSARVVISSRQGSLAEQVRRSLFAPIKVLRPRSFDLSTATKALKPSELHTPPLQSFNGLGGFTIDGSEYVTVLDKNAVTPAPWINVIANPNFGFQVSESGSGYTWAQNSRENQLTPWSNDPVCDPTGEAFYIRDEDSGALWSPTANPIRIADTKYIAFHGQGYSRFLHAWNGIESELTQFVSWTKPIKLSRLKLTNHSGKTRNLSASAYVEWVLGFSRPTMAPSTVTEVDPDTGAVFAFNARSDEYGSKIAFATFANSDQNFEQRSNQEFTCDRSEFIGRNGNLSRPLGLLSGETLSGRSGAGIDPCAAFTKFVEILPGESVEVVFMLGQAESREQARELLRSFSSETRFNVETALSEVRVNWETILTKTQVSTPDSSMNLMLNRWLLYQTTVCRFWARAAFYQAGGAFGFRDQLQDVMAIAVTQPEVAREHILRAAARQFNEGDVQHWWHPPFGRGVRTRISDDLIWLPYVVSHYLKVTGDTSILNQEISFLEGPLLRTDQEDSYYTPQVSLNAASLFEHCARALDRSLATGVHGLPLMGAGDWNDGMNRVGHDGRGESVWLAWFLSTNLLQFAPLALKCGDDERAALWVRHAKELRAKVEETSWDGRWYRRAYFDDGTPLGSHEGAECRIDSLTQTWAVLSGGAEATRAKTAMQSVEDYLVRAKDQMILLFTPAFDKTPLDPGYIKGYVPGVRENGGQYTHAAVWCVMAYATLGDGKRATELFSLLNPVNHSRNPSERETYKVEPYVLAADVYSEPPYTGRGGWTWYTGSSGWMYRSGIESILGLNVVSDTLVLDPCIDPSWPGFSLRYKHKSSVYEIEVTNPNKVSKGSQATTVDLKDDGKTYAVKIVLN